MTPVPVERCGRCGAQVADVARFCPGCGVPITRQPKDDPLVGTVVGERFRLLSRIGQGGSGTIYRAEHVTLRRKLAVKILHAQHASDELSLERFRREATVVAEMQNDHLVEVADFGRTSDARLFFAMELLEGETLGDLLGREGTLHAARVIDILGQIAEGLMEAHALGYVHRDLRPANIFLVDRRGRPGFVKILDFGLAKLIRTDRPSQRTVLGMTFGDPRYMSPEQAAGIPVDARSDIYALGLLGYEMLVGRPPFAEGDVARILHQQVDAQPVPPSRIRPDVPAALESVIMTALAKKSDERYPTALRFMDALAGRSGTPVAAGAAAPPPAAPPPRRPQSLDAPMPSSPGTVKKPDLSFSLGDGETFGSETYRSSILRPAGTDRLRRIGIYAAVAAGSLALTLLVGTLVRGRPGPAPVAPAADPAAQAPPAAAPSPAAPARVDPGQADFQARLGSSHLRRGERDKAHLCFKRALELDPQNAEARRGLAEMEGKTEAPAAPKPAPAP